MRRVRLGLPAIAALCVSVAVGAADAPSAPVSGEAVYNRWCVHCHSTGRGNPGTDSLQVKYGGKVPAAILERRDLAPEAVSVFVRQGALSMPPFRKTEISDAELGALSAYVSRNFPRRR